MTERFDSRYDENGRPQRPRPEQKRPRETHENHVRPRASSPENRGEQGGRRSTEARSFSRGSAQTPPRSDYPTGGTPNRHQPRVNPGTREQADSYRRDSYRAPDRTMRSGARSSQRGPQVSRGTTSRVNQQVSMDGRNYHEIPLRRKRSVLKPLVIVGLLVVVAFAVFFISPWGQGLFNPPKANNSSDAASVVTPVSAGQGSFTLKGEPELTLMARSFYQEEGTSLSSEEVTIEGNVDTNQVGDYAVQYTHGSETLTRVVHVVDERQIVMNLNGSQETYVKQGQAYVESGSHAIDQAGNNLSASIEITGTVDSSTAGDYPVIYKVSDGMGVQCVKKRTVHVVPENEFVANTTGVPVLMYHYVNTADNPPVDDPFPNNFILDTKLEEHLQYFVENGYYFPSFVELNAYAKGELDLPQNSVVLTFDDGEAGFLNYGIPLMEKYQVPATSFVIACDADASDKVRNYASEYISFQSHSFAMHQAGGSVGHGGIISAMSKDEIVEDLTKAQAIVQNTEALAYPFGDHTETAHEAVLEAGLMCAFTTEYGRVQPGSDVTCLPRVRISGDISFDGFVGSVS